MSTDDVAQLKTLGNQAFSSGDFTTAVEYFTQAIDKSPAPNHVLYSNRSGAYTSMHQYENALQDAEKCIEINGEWAKGYNRRAAAYQGMGQQDKALESYNKALELDPSNATAQQQKQSLEQQQQQSDDLGLGKMFSDPNLIANLKSNPKTAEMMADPAFARKIEGYVANPKQIAQDAMADPRILTVMGVLLGIDLNMMNPQSSNDTTTSTTSSNSNNTNNNNTTTSTNTTNNNDTSNNNSSNNDNNSAEEIQAEEEKAEGNKAYKSKDFDTAIEHYNKAYELNNNITYLNNRAAAEFEKGDYMKVLETLKDAVEKGRAMHADYTIIAKSFARMGNAYHKLGELDNAIDFYQKSLTEHRTPKTLSKLRAAQKELKEKAAKEYINPEKAEEARMEGKEYFSKGDWPNAVKSYTEMIKRDPLNAKGYSNRAAALSKLMSFPEAIEDCNKAIECDPSFLRPYIRKATAEVATKQYGKAMKTLSEVGGLDTENKFGGEINALYQKASSQRFKPDKDNETPEETYARVMKDPEVAEIMQDPVMQNILQQARDNQQSLQEHMKNPEIRRKIMTLAQAGIIKSQ